MSPRFWSDVVFGVLHVRPETSSPCCSPLFFLCRKKKCDKQNDSETYIKKPLNAFMIFRKEERENVMAEMKITDSATINSILGRRVRASALPSEFTLSGKNIDVQT